MSTPVPTEEAPPPSPRIHIPSTPEIEHSATTTTSAAAEPTIDPATLSMASIQPAVGGGRPTSRTLAVPQTSNPIALSSMSFVSAVFEGNSAPSTVTPSESVGTSTFATPSTVAAAATLTDARTASGVNPGLSVMQMTTSSQTESSRMNIGGIIASVFGMIRQTATETVPLTDLGWATIALPDTTMTAVAMPGTAPAVAVGAHTVTVGGLAATTHGAVVSNGPNGLEVEDVPAPFSSLIATSATRSGETASTLVLTLQGSTFTAVEQAAGRLAIGSQTLSVGDRASIIHGATVSVMPSGVVINGTVTETFTDATPSFTPNAGATSKTSGSVLDSSTTTTPDVHKSASCTRVAPGLVVLALIVMMQTTFIL
ncbi:hypothetical protein B0A48_12667 [Cryoendolithus antarcticus]|uniref:Uncharacterized protein n=1 Tax=Cryoendolithus antarcticus TaxID=1507870 RepID=A0A1V8SRK1_9PEZI|nr:hypothetical protein B0A48_12667 [Cryoendolithus antarcticus]